jgi:uncharacterized protein Veg
MKKAILLVVCFISCTSYKESVIAEEVYPSVIVTPYKESVIAEEVYPSVIVLEVFDGKTLQNKLNILYSKGYQIISPVIIGRSQYYTVILKHKSM